MAAFQSGAATSRSVGRRSRKHRFRDGSRAARLPARLHAGAEPASAPQRRSTERGQASRHPTKRCAWGVPLRCATTTKRQGNPERAAGPASTHALALQVAHAFDYLSADVAGLRGRVSGVLSAWSPGLPGYHAVLAMHAFSLVECGQYERAEAIALEALALEPVGRARIPHAGAHLRDDTAPRGGLRLDGRPRRRLGRRHRCRHPLLVASRAVPSSARRHRQRAFALRPAHPHGPAAVGGRPDRASACCGAYPCRGDPGGAGAIWPQAGHHARPTGSVPSPISTR